METDKESWCREFGNIGLDLLHVGGDIDKLNNAKAKIGVFDQWK